MTERVSRLLACTILFAFLACHRGKLSCQDVFSQDVNLNRLTAESFEPASLSLEAAPNVSAPDVEKGSQSSTYKLVDFSSFKTKFHKHYASIIEEIARQKLFLARYLKAKLSQIAYRLGLSTMYLGINQMSDWTDKERDATRNKLESGEHPDHQQAFRAKRGTGEDSVAGQSMTCAGARRIGKTYNSTALDRGCLPIIFKKKQKDGGGGSSSGPPGGAPPSRPGGDGSPSRGESTRVDLRRTDCFNTPGDQGACGACYAFAGVALYEYMHCMGHKRRKLMKFSEQYVVDCGKRLFEMNGCGGGNIHQVADFANFLGMERQSRFPYLGEESVCPYDFDTMEMAGILIARDSDLIEDSLDEWENWLHRRVPLYVSMGMDTNYFFDYAGGIDFPLRCSKEGHALLVVGAGSDKNGDYFICRNSMGPSWGRGGYYYVYKDTPCWMNGGMGYATIGLKNLGKKAFRKNKRRRRDMSSSSESATASDSDDGGSH